MNITLKTKIRYNGQEYSSPDELPPEIRSFYEQAMKGGANLLVKKSVTGRLVVNGKEISASGMSADEKKLYDDAMQLVRDNSAADLTITDGASPSNTPSAATARPTTTDSGWLTKGQIQLIVFVAGVLLALALIVAARH